MTTADGGKHLPAAHDFWLCDVRAQILFQLKNVLIVYMQMQGYCFLSGNNIIEE